VEDFPVRKRTIAFAAALPLWLLSAAPALAQSSQDQSVEAAFTLTAAEAEKAVALARREVDARKLRLKSALQLISVEWAREKSDKEGAPDKRMALVTHYRYEDDAAILTLVEPAASRVAKVEVIPHLPVPLSQEEFQRASALAMKNPQVAEALGPSVKEVKTEALMLRTSDEKDKLFGHRVVRLLFRLGTDYLTRPVVFVDLTTQKVWVEEPHTDHEQHKSAD
jgi:Cu2+-containing amine oxidase